MTTANQFDPGDILLVNFPFTDQSSTKLRPVAVVSTAVVNRSGDLILLPLSSVAPRGIHSEYTIEDTDPDFPQTGLKMTSTVKCSKPMTVHQSMVMRRLGSLTDQMLLEVFNRLQESIEVPSGVASKNKAD